MPTTARQTSPEITLEADNRKVTVTALGRLVIETKRGDYVLGADLTPRGRMVLVQALLHHEVAHPEHTEGAVEQTVEAVNALLRTLPFGSFEAVRDILQDIRGDKIADTAHIEAVPNHRRSRGVVEKSRIARPPGYSASVPPARATTSADIQRPPVDGERTARDIGVVKNDLEARGIKAVRVRMRRETLDALAPDRSRSDPATIWGLDIAVVEEHDLLPGDWALDQRTTVGVRGNYVYATAWVGMAVRLGNATVPEPQMHPGDAAAVANDTALWNSAREMTGEQATPAEVLAVAKWLERRITGAQP